jgi:hypothetical protein
MSLSEQQLRRPFVGHGLSTLEIAVLEADYDYGWHSGQVESITLCHKNIV